MLPTSLKNAEALIVVPIYDGVSSGSSATVEQAGATSTQDSRKGISNFFIKLLTFAAAARNGRLYTRKSADYLGLSTCGIAKRLYKVKPYSRA